ncbi:Gfo/Idh/MocA family protein [Metabacillus sp. 84]|uniref:Gfo/Idh/MocA family protein n=1 Tax=unclassified Metabacillus TaxID=2675274 RepID=UPI003CF26067
MQHFRLAIIGAGAIFSNHRQAVSQVPGLEFIAAADLDEGKKAQITGQGLAYYKDYKTMTLLEKPDAVVISLPHHLHKEAAIWCAGQKCHLLIEKPLAITYQDCLEIEHICDIMEIKVMTAHVQRYFPEKQAVKKIIVSRRLGNLLGILDKRHLPYFHSARPGWFFEKDQCGGGIFMNLGAHSFDKILWLTDQRLEAVSSDLKWHTRYQDIESSGCAFFKTEKGIPVKIELCGENDDFVNQTELQFTKGKILLETGAGARVFSDGNWSVLSHSNVDPFNGLYEESQRLLSSAAERTMFIEEAKEIVHLIETIYSLNNNLGGCP